MSCLVLREQKKGNVPREGGPGGWDSKLNVWLSGALLCPGGTPALYLPPGNQLLGPFDFRPGAARQHHRQGGRLANLGEIGSGGRRQTHSRKDWARVTSVLLTRGASEQECTPPRSRYKVANYFYKLWLVLTPTPTPKMALCSSRARSADDEDGAGGPRRGRPPPALPLSCTPGPNLPLCDSAVAATVCRQSQRQSAGPRTPRSPTAARPNFRPPAPAPSPPPARPGGFQPGALWPRAGQLRGAGSALGPPAGVRWASCCLRRLAEGARGPGGAAGRPAKGRGGAAWRSLLGCGLAAALAPSSHGPGRRRHARRRAAAAPRGVRAAARPRPTPLPVRPPAPENGLYLHQPPAGRHLGSGAAAGPECIAAAGAGAPALPGAGEGRRRGRTRRLLCAGAVRAQRRRPGSAGAQGPAGTLPLRGAQCGGTGKQSPTHSRCTVILAAGDGVRGRIISGTNQRRGDGNVTVGTCFSWAGVGGVGVGESGSLTEEIV